jgi:hypothetical protein
MIKGDEMYTVLGGRNWNEELTAIDSCIINVL